jgi:hypothetical protein
MAGTLAPDLFQAFYDVNGNPLAGYKLFTYAAGTSDKLDTFSDVALAVPNPNPITLDTAGRPSVGASRVALYLSPGLAYKFVIALPTDTDPPVAPVLTQDNVGAVPGSSVDIDVAAIAGESASAGEQGYLADGSGGTTAGRWYKGDATSAAKSVTPRITGFFTTSVLAGAATTVRIGGRATGLSGLTPGTTYFMSTTPGQVTSTPGGAFVRFLGVADGLTTLVIAPNPFVKYFDSIQSKSANYTATVDDDLILGTGTWTLTLYAAGGGNIGRKLRVKNNGTGVITIDGNSSETVHGTVTTPLFPGEEVLLTSDGSNWIANFSGVRRVDVVTTLATFSNNANENTLYSFSVPANTLGTNRVLHFRAFILIETDGGGARNVNFRVKFGATTFLGGNMPLPAAETHFLALDIHLFEGGTTNSQRVVGTMLTSQHNSGGAAWLALSATASMLAGNVTGAEDTTAAKTFALTAQMDAAAVSFTTTMSAAELTLE